MAKASETIALTASAKANFAQLARSLKGQLEVADTVSRSGAYAE